MPYDSLAKTANFPVADGFVSCACTFHYLGSLINYSLCNEDNITARIASATAAMGVLKKIWHNPTSTFTTSICYFTPPQ